MRIALRELGKELNQAWRGVADGWRELLRRSGDALTRFVPRKDSTGNGDAVTRFPVWGMLPGEAVETAKSVIITLELPGIEREDCDIRVEGDTLRVRGERRQEREHVGADYYVMERAYGSFERAIPLPDGVDPDSANATFKNGILRIELTKTRAPTRRRVDVR